MNQAVHFNSTLKRDAGAKQCVLTGGKFDAVVDEAVKSSLARTRKVFRHPDVLR
jgi:hypothetical protein